MMFGESPLTLKAKGSKSEDNIKTTRDTIEGHEACQTSDAKWLGLTNIYNHFQRPNFYDIGGTTTKELAGFWFLYKTEQVSRLYLLHLFVCNHQQGSFSFSLCNSNEMTMICERTGTVHLNSISKVYTFKDLPHSKYSYLTTYNFNELDVELMKDKKLLIAIAFKTIPVKKAQVPIDDLKKFHDFAQLLLDPVGADFTMVSADGKKFPVHKFLLAERSEVFKAMLKDDTAESINNFVAFGDVNNEDLSCIIEFIYTGTVKEMENKNCFNLLMLADRYDLGGLKELSQHALTRLLNRDNALETLIASDMYNSPILKIYTLKYIKKNITFFENSIFEQINNIQLVQDLCNYLVTKY